MLAYIAVCITSVVFVSIYALLGYFLFNWACPTGNIFFVIVAYVCWIAGSFVWAFCNGWTNNKIKSFFPKTLRDLRNPVAIRITVWLGASAAWLWAAMLVISAIYPWFKLPLALYPWDWLKAPYTIGLILVQGVGTYHCLAMAGFDFLMVSLMTYGDDFAL